MQSFTPEQLNKLREQSLNYMNQEVIKRAIKNSGINTRCDETDLSKCERLILYYINQIECEENHDINNSNLSILNLLNEIYATIHQNTDLFINDFENIPDDIDILCDDFEEVENSDDEYTDFVDGTVLCANDRVLKNFK